MNPSDLNPPAAPSIITLHHLRDIFASRPDSLWCVDRNWIPETGQRCAFGHLLQIVSFNGALLTSWSDALIKLFEPLRESLPETFFMCGMTVSRGRDSLNVAGTVNNGVHPLYQQSTPRARILAAIDDLIAAEEAKHAAELEAVETRALVPVARPECSKTSASVSPGWSTDQPSSLPVLVEVRS